MRIREISVTKLFNIFDHHIPLNADDRITIIHGPNGFGKTVLLRMLDGLFKPDFFIFFRIPFAEFRLGFDDGSNLLLQKVDQKRDGEKGSKLLVKYSRPDSKPETYALRRRFERPPDIPLSAIEDLLPDLTRIGPREWRHVPTGQVFSLEEVFERFGDRFGELFPFDIRRYQRELPEWLEELTKSIHIRFIDTERLFMYPSSPRPRRYDVVPPMIPAVREYSEELSEIIRSKLAESAALSQSLDRTFPRRLVERKPSPDITYEELRVELDALEHKRSRLMDAGLLDREDIDFQVPEEVDEDTEDVLKSVLSVYVKDVEQKLSIFDELADKIDVLKKIINDRFFYKRMSISKDDGFAFTIPNRESLSPADLSSGEQHELVLLYELLFKIQPNSLILIDEPELSLHIAWQKEFLRDLREVIRLSGFDVLIATHSPQIIHDRWDLTISLEGPIE